MLKITKNNNRKVKTIIKKRGKRKLIKQRINLKNLY